MAAKTGIKILSKQVNIISLDLGTKNLIVRVNQQTVYDQPSALVFDIENGQVIIGQEALLMKEKTPPNKIYKEPMENGVISDIDSLIVLLTEIFVNIVKINDPEIWKNGSLWENSVVLVAIPSKVFRLDWTVLKETFEGKHSPKLSQYGDKFERFNLLGKEPVMKATKVVIVPEVMLAAMGAGKSIWSSQGVFVLDIGGGTSDCAIISAGDVIVQDTRPVAGNALDRALQNYFEQMHYLAISAEEAERTKIAAGLWVDGAAQKENKIKIYGKSTKTGNPEKISVSKEEIARTLNDAFRPIIDLCKEIIFAAGPSFSRTLQENGLVITGGGALLENIAPLMMQELDFEHVSIANDPQKCVIKGTEAYEMHKNDLFERGFIRPSK